LTNPAFQANVQPLIPNPDARSWLVPFWGLVEEAPNKGSSVLAMQRYELLYIIPATLTDEDVGTAETAVKAVLEKNGAAIESTTRLGKFRLTYPIKKVRHGHYVLVYFTCERAIVGKIDQTLRITPEVLRHLTLRADEAGGEKFDLVQFVEVNVEAAKEAKEARRREKSDKAAEDLKNGVVATEGAEEKPAAATEEKSDEAKPALSDEEIDKKINAALQDNA